MRSLLLNLVNIVFFGGSPITGSTFRMVELQRAVFAKRQKVNKIQEEIERLDQRQGELIEEQDKLTDAFYEAKDAIFNSLSL